MLLSIKQLKNSFLLVVLALDSVVPDMAGENR